MDEFDNFMDAPAPAGGDEFAAFADADGPADMTPKGPQGRRVAAPVPRGIGQQVMDGLDPFLAIPDIAATATTGVIGDVAGKTAGLGAMAVDAVGTLFGRDPGATADPASVRDAVSGALTWRPQTQAGQTLTSLAAKPFEYLEEQKGRTADIARESGGDLAGDLTQAGLNAAQGALEYLPGVSGARAAAAAPRAAGALPEMSAAERAGVLARPDPVKQASRPEEVARALGLKVRPSDVQVNRGAPKPGMMDRVSESLVDRAGVGRDFSIDNAEKINTAASKDIGLPDGAALDAPAFDALRKPSEKVYESVSGLPQTVTSPEYNSAINSLKGERGADAKVKDAITALQAEFAVPGAPKDMLASIKALRSRARKQIQSDDIVANEVGYANRRMAGLLEDELERVAVASGNTDLLKEFRTARRDLAKIHVVEDSVVAGHVDASLLKKAREKGAKLDGRLAAIADSAEFFPEVTKRPHQVIKGENPPPTTFAEMTKRVAGKLGPERRLKNGYQDSIFPENDAALGEYFKQAPEKPLPEGASAPNPFGGPEGPQAADLRAQATAADDRGLAAELFDGGQGRLPGEPIEWDQQRGIDRSVIRDVNNGAPSGVELVDQPAPFFPDGDDIALFDDAPPELSVGGTAPVGAPTGELSLADLLLGDSPGMTPEPFRPAAGDVLRADRNMAPRQITAGSTTGRLTPVDIFEGGEPFADVLEQGDLALEREAYRPPAGDTVDFQRTSAPGLSDLLEQLGLVEPRSGGVNPNFAPDTSLAGDLELSPLPRRALAEADLSLVDDDFQRAQPATDFDAPAPEAELSLADELTGPRSRREPGEPETGFPDRYRTPGAIRRESESGYIAYEEKGKDWNINDAFVKDEKRGQGVGKAQLLDLAMEAVEAGKTLNSDKSLTKAQAKVYESLRKAGKLTFDVSDEKAFTEGLKSGTIRAGGKPVITNIKPGPKVK